MFFWPKSVKNLQVILSRRAYTKLLSEAKRSNERGEERAEILIGIQEDENEFFVEDIVCHDEITAKGLARITSRPDESWEALESEETIVYFYTHFNFPEIQKFLQERLANQRKIILAHSHHPDYFDTTLDNDYAISLSQRCVALVFTYSSGKLIAIAFKGGKRIEVTSR